MPESHSDHREPTRFALSSLIDAMPDAIVIVNTDGQIVDANLQALGMFGYSRAELLGQPVEMLVPEDKRESHLGERQSYVDRPRVRPMGAGIELSAQHKDGHEFQVEINIAPYQSPDGLLVVSAVRDVAAQKGGKPEGA